MIHLHRCTDERAPSASYVGTIHLSRFIQSFLFEPTRVYIVSTLVQPEPIHLSCPTDNVHSCRKIHLSYFVQGNLKAFKPTIFEEVNMSLSRNDTFESFQQKHFEVLLNPMYHRAVREIHMSGTIHLSRFIESALLKAIVLEMMNMSAHFFRRCICTVSTRVSSSCLILER